MFSENYDLTTSLKTDFFAAFTELSAEEQDAYDRAHQIVEELLPEMNEAWENATQHPHWLKRLGELDLLSDGCKIPDQSQISPLAAGLINMELSRGDGSLATLLAVQGGLAIRSISAFGSEEQKEKYLKPLAAGDLHGAFALTEPTHGSDSTSLETTAVLDGDEYVINGEKKWIGNGAAGGITIVWAREDASQKVRGFIVDQDTAGYTAEVIRGKISLRAIHQAHITLENVRVPKSQVLPNASGFSDTAKVLYASRMGVAWSALGHATAIYEAAVSYAKQRKQFSKELGNFQLIQEKLSRMLSDLTTMQLICVQAAKLDNVGELVPLQASLAKFHNTRKAREIAQIGRDMLGGNGILLEHHVARHFVDIESLHTYEGTESIHALLLGREITGFSAFS